MNRTTLTIAFAFVACISFSQVFAQAPAAATTVNVPVSKMAVIYSEQFQDPKTGIARFTVTLNRLNGEFQKVQDDLTQTAQRLTAQQNEITKLQQVGGATPAQIQARIDSYLRLCGSPMLRAPKRLFALRFLQGIRNRNSLQST